ncbi:uncharacterized protein stbd1 [Halichoeres trimaculatus]|uniref:uncharacterized protein stbd1 n=1 Tax=Halichoeres trimaculatus TaxID=147232 RepID=UPI003D9DBA3C
MSLENSNAVAVERRMDLASLFCMIGRHGPAVVVAVLAMVSLLAGFIIYRTVRGKRRKATAADSDGKPPGAERDASVIQAHPEENQNPGRATELLDGGSPDVKEDVNLSDHNIRHRRAAAGAPAEKPSPCFTPKDDIRVVEIRHTSSDDRMETAVVNSYKVAETRAEETHQSRQSDVTNEVIEDVVRGTHDISSCLKERISDVNNKEDKVLKADGQDDEHGITDETVPEEETRDDEVEDSITFVETNGKGSTLEEPVVLVEDAPVSIIHNVKEEESEPQDPDGAVSFNCNTEKEQRKTECEEAEEECEDYLLNPQQAVSQPPTFEEVNLPSLEQDQRNPAVDEVVSLIESRDWVQYPDPTEEVSEADCSDPSLNFPPTRNGYEMTPSLDEDTTSSTLQSVMLSDEDKESDPAAVVLAAPDIAASDGVNVESLVTAEEKPPHVSSCYREQLSVKLINDVSSQERDFVVANAAENTASPETSYPLMLTTCQDQHMGNGNFDLLIPSTFEAPACNVHPTAPLTAEEVSFPDLKIDQRDEAESFGETFVSDAPACNTSFTTLLITSSPDQLSVHLTNATEEEGIDTCSAFDKASLTPLTASEEICQSDMFASYLAKNTEDFPEVSTSSALAMTDATFPICMPSFEHNDLGFSDLSSPDIGKESGISSMAVSPDPQDSGFEVIAENLVEDDRLSSAQTESKDSWGSTAGMVFGPYPTRQPHPPHTEQTDWTIYESFATNEDTFGHEIEDRYHREMNQFMAQIVDSITSLADELTEAPDRKVTVEVVEKEEKKAEGRVGKKAETKTEEEEAVEVEKTEISIMEATMDNNEWITDSNYQVLPWMNISSPSVDQNHNKNNQLSSEKCAALTDTPCVDAHDDLPATEVKPTSSPTLVDESNKKVLAVQPMPQSVNVTFRVHYFTQSPYQTVAVTGDQQELGNWREFISLERAKDGHWTTVVSLPAESHVEWKFLLLDKGEVCRWEECGNRLLETGSGDDLLVHKWWGTL